MTLQLNFQDTYRQADHIIPGLHLDMRERAEEGRSPLPETWLYHKCLCLWFMHNTMHLQVNMFISFQLIITKLKFYFKNYISFTAQIYKNKVRAIKQYLCKEKNN